MTIRSVIGSFFTGSSKSKGENRLLSSEISPETVTAPSNGQKINKNGGGGGALMISRKAPKLSALRGQTTFSKTISSPGVGNTNNDRGWVKKIIKHTWGDIIILFSFFTHLVAMIDLLLPDKWVTKNIEDKLLWCQQHLKGNAVFLPFPNSDTWPMEAKPAAHFCFPLKPLPQQLPPRTPIILHLLLLITKVSKNFLKSENFEKTKFLQHKFSIFSSPALWHPFFRRFTAKSQISQRFHLDWVVIPGNRSFLNFDRVWRLIYQYKQPKFGQ